MAILIGTMFPSEKERDREKSAPTKLKFAQLIRQRWQVRDLFNLPCLQVMIMGDF